MTSSTRRRGAACLALAALAAAVLAGCDDGGAGPRDADDGWRYDMAAGVYYQVDGLSSDPGLLRARLPALGPDVEGSWIEGRRTNPHDRVPIPAQDDYVWQTVAVVGPARTAELVAKRATTDTGQDVVSDAELRRELVAPLEGSAGMCPRGWAPVQAGTPEAPSRTAEGSDWISLAVACPGGDRVVVLTHDT